MKINKDDILEIAEGFLYEKWESSLHKSYYSNPVNRDSFLAYLRLVNVFRDIDGIIEVQSGINGDLSVEMKIKDLTITLFLDDLYFSGWIEKDGVAYKEGSDLINTPIPACYQSLEKLKRYVLSII